MPDTQKYIYIDGMWRRRGFPALQPGGLTTPVDPPPVDPGVLPEWGEPTWRDEFDNVDSNGNLKLDTNKWKIWDFNTLSEGTFPSTLGYLNDCSVVKGRQVAVVNTTDGDTAVRIRSEWMTSADAASHNLPSVPMIRNGGVVSPQTYSWFKTAYIDQRTLNNGNRQQYGRWEMSLWIPVIPDHGLGMLWAFWLRNGSSGEWDLMESWGSGPAAATAVPNNGANLYPRAAQPKPNAGTTTNTIHRDTSPPTTYVDPNGVTRSVGSTEKVALTHTQSPALAGRWVKCVAIWTPTVFEVSYDGVVKTYFKRTPNRVNPNEADPTHWNTPAGAKYPVARLDPDGIQRDLWTAPTLRSPWYLRMNAHPGPSTTSFGVPDANNRDWTWASDFMCKYVRRWDYGQYTGTDY